MQYLVADELYVCFDKMHEHESSSSEKLVANCFMNLAQNIQIIRSVYPVNSLLSFRASRCARRLATNHSRFALSSFLFDGSGTRSQVAMVVEQLLQKIVIVRPGGIRAGKL